MQLFNKKENKNKINMLCSAGQFSVAPMLDWTDRHCRVFYRKLSCHAWLYTEMVTTGAMIYGNNLERFIGFSPDEELPVVLQLGGSDPEALAQCAKIGENWGYSEINLNVGCPSDRVQNNLIGACLMKHPQLVTEGVAAMKAAVSIPVTVKTRIGIDDQENYETLKTFVAGLVSAGVDGLIIHARKAWLQGLSPKENREIPPLKYEWVHQLKADFPTIPISLNGGLTSLDQAQSHLQIWQNLPAVDGVMMGRSVYEQPYLLAEVDARFYHDAHAIPDRFEVVAQMLPYIEQYLQKGGRLIHITRHMLGLFHGQPGGRKWRRYLSENAHQTSADIQTVQKALQLVRQERALFLEYQQAQIKSEEASYD